MVYLRPFLRHGADAILLILLIGLVLTLARAVIKPVSASTELLHVVSVTTPLQGGASITTETFVDQASGDASVREFSADGQLRSVRIRRELVVVDYLVQTRGLVEERVLSKDDPALQAITAHLDGYAKLLERGQATRVGEVILNGQRALEIRVAPGTEHEQHVFLDLATLYPLEIRARDGSGVVIQYRVVETLSRSAISDSTFVLDLPVVYKEAYQRLSPTDVAQFSVYPLWSLGSTFRDYHLWLAQRVRTEGQGSYDTDAVYLTYRRASDPATELIIISRGSFNALEQAGLARAEKNGVVAASEAVVVRGEPARLRPEAGGFRLTLERTGSVVFVWSEDRATVLAAAEALKVANGH